MNKFETESFFKFHRVSTCFCSFLKIIFTLNSRYILDFSRNYSKYKEFFQKNRPNLLTNSFLYDKIGIVKKFFMFFENHFHFDEIIFHF